MPRPSQATPLTALLLITLVEAVRQPIALPGARNAPPIAAHEVARDVALIGEVVPGEQLALCGERGEEVRHAARAQAPSPLRGLCSIQVRMLASNFTS